MNKLIALVTVLGILGGSTYAMQPQQQIQDMVQKVTQLSEAVAAINQAVEKTINDFTKNPQQDQVRLGKLHNSIAKLVG